MIWACHWYCSILSNSVSENLHLESLLHSGHGPYSQEVPLSVSPDFGGLASNGLCGLGLFIYLFIYFLLVFWTAKSVLLLATASMKNYFPWRIGFLVRIQGRINLIFAFFYNIKEVCLVMRIYFGRWRCFEMLFGYLGFVIFSLLWIVLILKG